MNDTTPQLTPEAQAAIAKIERLFGSFHSWTPNWERKDIILSTVDLLKQINNLSVRAGYAIKISRQIPLVAFDQDKLFMMAGLEEFGDYRPGFYLAGKMGGLGAGEGGNWRTEIVSASTLCRTDDKWPVAPNAVMGRFDYAGPYYTDDDPLTFVTRCRAAIERCDVMFAWIDSRDAYGTFAEIGLARALEKEIWLGFPESIGDSIKDMWFVKTMCERGGAFSSPRSMFDYFLPFFTIDENLDSDLRTMPYKEYLKTDHWQAVRRGALERAGNRCQLCNNTKKLHVHHRTYERRGCEEPEDVIVLCAGCHAKFHDKLPVMPS